jgi:N-methylhydantoinase B
VVTEIVRNAVVAITEEMKTNLMRTAYSMIIYEAQDFTVGLFSARAEIISIGIGLPTFVRGIGHTIQAMLKHFGDDIVPGDVLVTNDAYLTGSHLNHITLVVPIFSGNTLVAFSACMAHWADIGGALNVMTRDIFSEGLQVPILKMYSAGKLNTDLVSILHMNVRIPERAIGDLHAQTATVRTGARRFLELIGRYGCDAVLNSIAAIMDHSEAQARKQVLSIPDGVYEAESYMDDDGVDAGKRVPIGIKVTVAGDEMTIDLTDVSGQVKGFYNSGEAAGRGCCQVAFKCVTSGLERPINEGSFRPLKIVLPAGRVVSATKPAPMRRWMTYPMTVIDTIFKALAPAIPHRVIAGHHAELMTTQVHGHTDGKIFLLSGGLTGGGWGAKSGADGSNATICINDGDTHNSPSEQIEAKYPVHVVRYALRQDSGGAGRWQGGLGTEKMVQATDDVVMNSYIERVYCRPWGLFGGHPAAGNQVCVQVAGAEQELRFPSGKVIGRPSNRATPTCCAPAAAAGTNRRSTARWKRSKTTCARAIFPGSARSPVTAWFSIRRDSWTGPKPRRCGRSCAFWTARSRVPNWKTPRRLQAMPIISTSTSRSTTVRTCLKESYSRCAVLTRLGPAWAVGDRGGDCRIRPSHDR